MGTELVKRKNASELVLTVMIWAIVGLLGTRLFLQITGYPQLATGGWHIAHAFSGGLVMTTGMMMDLIFFGEKIKKTAAGVFGLGLGLFIDEIGKYLSKDNNYFFQPAIMLIYIFFIVLFLIYKYLERKEGSKETIIEKETQWSWEKRMWNWVRKITYQKVFRRKIVIYTLLAVAVWHVVGGIGDAVYLFGIVKNDNDITMLTLKSFTELLVALMLGIGIYMVSRKKQRRGLKFFRYGLLMNIFLASVFKFYFEQFSAVIGVGFSVAIYYGLERLEKELTD